MSSGRTIIYQAFPPTDASNPSCGTTTTTTTSNMSNESSSGSSSSGSGSSSSSNTTNTSTTAENNHKEAIVCVVEGESIESFSSTVEYRSCCFRDLAAEEEDVVDSSSAGRMLRPSESFQQVLLLSNNNNNNQIFEEQTPTFRSVIHSGIQEELHVKDILHNNNGHSTNTTRRTTLGERGLVRINSSNTNTNTTGNTNNPTTIAGPTVPRIDQKPFLANIVREPSDRRMLLSESSAALVSSPQEDDMIYRQSSSRSIRSNTSTSSSPNTAATSRKSLLPATTTLESKAIITRNSVVSRGCGSGDDSSAGRAGPSPTLDMLQWNRLRLYDRHGPMQTLLDAFERRCPGFPPSQPTDEVTPSRSSRSSISSASSNTTAPLSSRSRQDSSHPRELVLITGHSGTGKTALAVQTFQHRPNILFVSGKFDPLLGSSLSQQQQQQQHHHQRPLSAIVTIMSRLVQRIMAQGPTVVPQVRMAIRQEISSFRQLQALMDTIPALKRLIGTVSTHVVDHRRADDPLCDANDKKEEQSQNNVSSSTSAANNQGGRLPMRAILQHGFPKLLRAIINTMKQPMVILLDDLQWADPSSLQWMAFLIQANLSNLLLIGTCRQEEVSYQHPLSQTLREMEDEDSNNGHHRLPLQITEVRIGNLTLEGVTQLVRDLLKWSDKSLSTSSSSIASQHRSIQKAAQKLPAWIYEQTSGNVFFVLQVIQGLVEAELLYHDGTCWHWQGQHGMLGLTHMSSLHPKYSPAGGSRGGLASSSSKPSTSSSSAPYTVVELLASRMQRLDPPVRRILQTAACLGNDFSQQLLLACIPIEEGKSSSRGNQGGSHKLTLADIEAAFAQAEDQGWIHLDDTSTLGRFTHDKFQEAMYSLIQAPAQLYHLQVARTLHQAMLLRQQQGETILDEDSHLFVVCNQFRLAGDYLFIPTMTQEVPSAGGKHYQSNEYPATNEEREQIAILCWKAAIKAASISAFSSAVVYVEFGIELLRGRSEGEETDADLPTAASRHWRDQYDLSLTLYNMAAELEYCNGHYQRVDTLVTEILQHARSFEDKLQAYVTHIYSMGSRGDGVRAMDEGFQVLQELGEAFPKRFLLLHTIRELIATQRLLKGKSDDDILNLPHVTDTKVLSAMKIIKVIYPHILSTKVEYAPLVAFRGIQITFRHGLSPMSTLFCICSIYTLIPTFSLVAPLLCEPKIPVYGLAGSVAFGLYSLTLMHATGDITECYRYGQLALRILDKMPAKEFVARTYGAVYGLIFPWKDPLRNSLEPLLTGHRTGLATGDLEISLMCCSLYGGACIFARETHSVIYHSSSSL